MRAAAARSARRMSRPHTPVGFPDMETASGIAPAAVVTLEDVSTDAAECESCGNEFVPTRGSAGRFCSHSCYAASLRTQPVPEARDCHCGSSFVPEPHNPGRFCSRGCMYEGLRVRPKPTPTTCETCGAWFLPKPSTRGRFCSRVCDYIARAKYPRPGIHVCGRPGCGREYRPVPSHVAATGARFCSYRCRMLVAWATGLVPVALLTTPRMRQRWLGKWAGQRAGVLGGRPREYLDEQAAQARGLRASGLSIRAIARDAKLSKWQVESIIAADEVSGNPS